MMTRVIPISGMNAYESSLDVYYLYLIHPFSAEGFQYCSFHPSAAQENRAPDCSEGSSSSLANSDLENIQRKSHPVLVGGEKRLATQS